MRGSYLLKRNLAIYVCSLSLSSKRLLLMRTALLIRLSNIIIAALLCISLCYIAGLSPCLYIS
jgi:hypothetical protein